MLALSVSLLVLPVAEQCDTCSDRWGVWRCVRTVHPNICSSSPLFKALFNDLYGVLSASSLLLLVLAPSPLCYSRLFVKPLDIKYGLYRQRYAKCVVVIHPLHVQGNIVRLFKLSQTGETLDK